MVTFGLVTEGITDQIVIENILCGYFNSNDIIVNTLQPLRDETDKNRAPTTTGKEKNKYGGWLLVFDNCQSAKFKEALPFNDYIIIQIDTDVSEEKHYDISKRSETGQELNAEQLTQRVKEKLAGLIGKEFYEQNAHKIIFAIAVHSTECWLLLLYYENNKKAKTAGCLKTLNDALQKQERFTIDAKKPEYYETISKQYRKNKILRRNYKSNPSLEIFIKELEERNIKIEDVL